MAKLQILKNQTKTLYEVWFYSEILKGWVCSPEDRKITNNPIHVVTWEYENQYPNRVFRLDVNNVTVYYSNGYFSQQTPRYFVFIYDMPYNAFTAVGTSYDGKMTLDEVLKNVRHQYGERGFHIRKNNEILFEQEQSSQLQLF